MTEATNDQPNPQTPPPPRARSSSREGKTRASGRSGGEAEEAAGGEGRGYQEVQPMTATPYSSHRCRACYRHRPTSEFRVLPAGDRARYCHACEERKAHREEMRRANPGHDAAPSERICMRCYGLTWRVAGIACRACGLRYAPEPAVAIDAAARPGSACSSIG